MLDRSDVSADASANVYALQGIGTDTAAGTARATGAGAPGTAGSEAAARLGPPVGSVAEKRIGSGFPGTSGTVRGTGGVGGCFDAKNCSPSGRRELVVVPSLDCDCSPRLPVLEISAPEWVNDLRDTATAAAFDLVGLAVLPLGAPTDFDDLVFVGLEVLPLDAVAVTVGVANFGDKTCACFAAGWLLATDGDSAGNPLLSEEEARLISASAVFPVDAFEGTASHAAEPPFLALATAAAVEFPPIDCRLASGFLAACASTRSLVD